MAKGVTGRTSPKQGCSEEKCANFAMLLRVTLVLSFACTFYKWRYSAIYRHLFLDIAQKSCSCHKYIWS